jgi:hypothetical protein
MTTKLQRAASAAVKAWCKQARIKLTGDVRHVHPRSYVVGRVAPSCLIVAECWADSEPQMLESTRQHPLTMVHTFDPSLNAGDWCITAYISTPGTGERVAVPIPEPR